MSKVDRYGWTVQGEQAEVDAKKIKKQDDTEAGRTTKWLGMFREWEEFTGKKLNVLARRINKGIPDTVRADAWLRIIEMGGAIRQLEAGAKGKRIVKIVDGKEEDFLKVEEYNQMERKEVFDVIDRDINRTFPQIQIFNEPMHQERLRRVLYAYCYADTNDNDGQLEYTQGMGFMAGFLLLYMDEEQALAGLYGILNGWRTKHRRYFVAGFPRVEETTKMWSELLRRRFPKVLNGLKNCDIDPSFYIPNWFIPAFLQLDWPPVVSLRLFDRFLFYGTRALLAFGLTIIDVLKDKMIGKTMDVILPLLQHPDRSKEMRDPEVVFSHMDSLWIRKKEYLQLGAVAGAMDIRVA